MQKFWALNGERSLSIYYNTKSNTKGELVNKGLESEKKRWSKHENKRTKTKSNAKSEPMSGLSKWKDQS